MWQRRAHEIIHTVLWRKMTGDEASSVKSRKGEDVPNSILQSQNSFIFKVRMKALRGIIPILQRGKLLQRDSFHPSSSFVDMILALGSEVLNLT